MAEDQKAPVVKSANRTLVLLELFAADPRPRTLTMLQSETGIPKSSLYGLLSTLVARSWLDLSTPGQLYSLGTHALELGAAFLRTPGRAALDHVLDRLADDVGETVNLGQLDGDQVVYLAVRKSRHSLALRSAPGLRLPAHATAMGKALLADLDDDAVRRLVREPLSALTPDTRGTVDEVLADLADVRSSGFAEEHGETSEGAGCIAVAVHGPRGQRLALSVSAPLVRFDDVCVARIRAALASVREHAERSLTLAADQPLG